MSKLLLAFVASLLCGACVDTTAPVVPVTITCTVHQLPDGTVYDVCVSR